MIDLSACWDNHVASVLADRDDGTTIHASDLHGCAFALHQRLAGVPQLPHDGDSFANFERGHAIEGRIEEALIAFTEGRGLFVTRGEKVEHQGIVGNLDFILYENVRSTVPLAIIDLSTTARKTPDWQYGHALKTAFYAVAKGCDAFAEWVFSVGFGGKIVAQQAYWFALDEIVPGRTLTWREAVAGATLDALLAAVPGEPPPAEPPMDPLTWEREDWRCGRPGTGKSYCRARCPRNQRYDAAADELEIPEVIA